MSTRSSRNPELSLNSSGTDKGHALQIRAIPTKNLVI